GRRGAARRPRSAGRPAPEQTIDCASSSPSVGAPEMQDVSADVGRSCDSVMTAAAARLEVWKVTTGCLTAQTCRIRFRYQVRQKAERAAQRTLTRPRNFKLRYFHDRIEQIQNIAQSD